MNIYNDCRVPRPFFWEIGRAVAAGALICGIWAVIAGIAAAILGNAPVFAAAGQVVFFAAPLFVIGWGICQLFKKRCFV